MTPVTAHFSVEEFACHDGTPYPAGWIEARLTPLCETLEALRAEVGPVRVDSGYRTLEYDARIYEASAKDGSVAPASRSQHPRGTAADVTCAWLPSSVFNLALDLYGRGRLPHLGGLGLYPNFVHVDVRPRAGDHLAIWGGHRPSNIA